MVEEVELANIITDLSNDTTIPPPGDDNQDHYRQLQDPASDFPPVDSHEPAISGLIASASAPGRSILFSASAARPLPATIVLPPARNLAEERIALNDTAEQIEEVILQKLQQLTYKGDRNAQFNLAVCLLKIGHMRCEWFRKFLRPELLDTIIPLSWFYEKTRGVEENHEAAKRLLQKAAQAGHVKAKTILGGCYYAPGKGTKDEERLAVELYRAAIAEGGDALAEYSLGLCYEYGVAKDKGAALRCYITAANKGFAPAENKLGEFNEHGKGGLARKGRAAFNWYNKSANQGYAPAEFNMGACYQYGIGHWVERDDDSTAYKWYCRAAQQGYPDAIKALRQFNKKGCTIL